MVELVVKWLNILYLDKVIVIFLVKLTIDLVDHTVLGATYYGYLGHFHLQY